MLKEKQRGVNSSLRKQLEYYFGRKNYHRDQFMQREARKHPENFISLDTMLTFNRIKALTRDKAAILSSIRDSKVVEASEDGDMLRQRQER